jgi:hypothetical protein
MFRPAPLNAYRRSASGPASAVAQAVVVRDRALLFYERTPEDDRHDHERHAVEDDPNNLN